MKQHRTRGVPIKLALLERALTQRDVARILNMGIRTLNMKILGNRPWRPHERAHLAQLLGKPESVLFPDQDTEGKPNTQGETPSCPCTGPKGEAA